MGIAGMHFMHNSQTFCFFCGGVVMSYVFETVFVCTGCSVPCNVTVAAHYCDVGAPVCCLYGQSENRPDPSKWKRVEDGNTKVDTTEQTELPELYEDRLDRVVAKLEVLLDHELDLRELGGDPDGI